MQVNSPTNLNMFWRPEMEVIPPSALIEHVMPWLPTFQQRVEAGGSDVPGSAHGVAQLLPYLATVVIQDALELCFPPSNEMFRADPVHKLLLQSPGFT